MAANSAGTSPSLSLSSPSSSLRGEARLKAVGAEVSTSGVGMSGICMGGREGGRIAAGRRGAEVVEGRGRVVGVEEAGVEVIVGEIGVEVGVGERGVGEGFAAGWVRKEGMMGALTAFDPEVTFGPFFLSTFCGFVCKKKKKEKMIKKVSFKIYM